MPSPAIIKKPLVVGTDNKPKQLQPGEYLIRENIRIPQIRVKVKTFDQTLKYTPIAVSASFQFDETYRNFDPQVWFFKLRRKGRKRQYDNDLLANRTRKVPEKWVHPTDVARGGKMQIPDGYAFWGESLYTHKTEWVWAVERFQWQNINFDPFEYFSFVGARLTPGDLPVDFLKINPSGVSGGRKKKARTVLGYFCMSIQDMHDPDVSVKNTRIFGPPSELLTIRPLVSTGSVVGLQVMLSTRSVKRNIP